MIGIPMIELQKLTLALPKCLICQPNDAGCSWIIDRQGDKVGDVNWHIPQITIYEEYEFSEEVIEVIGREKFKIREVEFDLTKREDHLPLPDEVINPIIQKHT